MIDLRAARADTDGYRAALARRGAADTFDALLAADTRWRDASTRRDEARTRQKALGKPSTDEEIAAARSLKSELQALDEELAADERERQEHWDRVPNIPDASVPEGGEDDAVEVRRVGEPSALDDPKEHTEIGRFEMERAARVSGSRFGYWVGDTALLALALYRLALDRLVEQGLHPGPAAGPRAGGGAVRNGLAAVAGSRMSTSSTARISSSRARPRSRSVASIGDEILEADDLPLRYVGFSPCFRSEAGAAGKDTRGMFRVHQFNKVEQFVFTRPEDSWAEHERLLENTEQIVQELGLPYRVVVLATGDMSKASAKTYDVEIWFPSQERYRETASVSNTTDYQARRLGARYRADGNVEPLHTLNGTAAVDRMALALLENFQGDVPDALVAYGAPARIG